MEILRVLVRWSGFTGAPGWSSFHFESDPGFWDGGLLGDAAQQAAESVASRISYAFGFLESHLPSDVTLTIEPTVEVIEAGSGEILGAIDLEEERSSTGDDAGGYSAASGGHINWRTNDYRFGRRIRGRTFIVPLAAAAYQDDGTLTNSALTSLRGFADGVVGEGSGPALGVWSRPRNGAGGVFATVTNGQVPDRVTVLRSRRD